MHNVKQKLSSCFRKAELAPAHCRICNYMRTLSTQRHNPLAAILMSLLRPLSAETQ